MVELNPGDDARPTPLPARPRVVRIVGASYSGSTALGYFLNTGENVVFGSELYRLLPAFSAPHDGAPPTLCDRCGPACELWSASLLQELQANPNARLRDVYDALYRQPARRVSILVDGSKSTRWYDDGAEDLYDITYVVTTKHPLRLISSFLYNHRELIPAQARHSLADCNRFLLEHRDDWLPAAETLVRELAARYARIDAFLKGREALWCATDDEAQVHATLAILGERLDARFELRRMAETPCHSIGGNRSLVWQTRGYEKGPLRPVQDQARFDYYRGMQQSGFLRDDKYRVLLAGGLEERVRQLARRCGLFDRLRYPDVG